MLYLIGNGPSQKNVDWEEFKDKEWWGFNAVSNNIVKPDLLFAIDIEVQAKIVDEEYYKTNKVAFAEFETVPIEMWDMMKMGIGEYDNFYEIRKDGDTEFSVQGSYDGKECFFIGISGDYGNNIVMYNNPKLKNLFGGMSALGYAIENGYKDICLIGFDDSPIAEQLWPSLSTIRQPVEEMACHAAKLLLGTVDGLSEQTESKEFKSELILRESLINLLD